MSSYSLGFIERGGTFAWALAGRGPSGWGLVDAGVSLGGEPLHDFVQRSRASWPRGLAPRVGLPLGLSSFAVEVGNRPTKEIVAGIRLDNLSEDSGKGGGTIVKVVPYGDFRLAVSVRERTVADIIAAWRAVGYEPQDIEPMEIALMRTFPDADAVLDARDLSAMRLLTVDDRSVIAHEAPDLSGRDLAESDRLDSVVQIVRNARAEVSALNSLVLIGDGFDSLAEADGDLTVTRFVLAGEVSPPWSDAFVIATFAAVRRAK